MLAWRNALIDRGITQPFKQAHREVYILTDAELDKIFYSNARRILGLDRPHAVENADRTVPAAE